MRGAVGMTVGVGLLAAPAVAATRPKPKAAAAQPAPVAPLSETKLAEVSAILASEDEGKAVAAVRALGDSKAPNAGEPLIEALAVGTTPPVAQEALAQLGKLRDPKAIQVLVLYSGNRTSVTRLAAVKALAALPDPRVVGTLMERLGDSDAEVRAVAATALRDRKETRAVDRLFKLVARNDAGAAAPLGTLAPPTLVPQIAELRGRVDDAVLASVFGEFIKRGDVPDRLRLDVVRTLGNLPGAAATTALVEYLAEVPEKESRPSRDEAQRLIDRRSANP